MANPEYSIVECHDSCFLVELVIYLAFLPVGFITTFHHHLGDFFLTFPGILGNSK